MALILQPGGSQGIAPRHYAKTMEIGVALTDLQTRLPAADYATLAERFSQSNVGAWGLRDGKTEHNLQSWKRFSAGDTVVFSGQGGLTSYASLLHKVHSRKLADWFSPHRGGEPWEYIYFTSPPQACMVAYTELRPLLGANA